MQDDSIFLLRTFKTYMDSIANNDFKPPNQDEYDQLIREKFVEINQKNDKLQTVTQKLGGIDKIDDEYLQDAKKRQNIQRKYRNLGM